MLKWFESQLMSYSLVKVFASAHLPLPIQNHSLKKPWPYPQLAMHRKVTDWPCLSLQRNVGLTQMSLGFSYKDLGQTYLITGST